MAVDNFKAECVSELFKLNRSEPYEAFGTIFYAQRSREGKYIYHVAKLEGGLVAKIDQQGVLSIENSLHKFWHGNNFSDFTFSEIQASVRKIESILKIPSNELKLKRAEIGWNVINVEQFYESFDLYSMNGYENMRNGRTIYGRKFYLTDINIKAYDKFIETKLNPNSVEIDDTGSPIPKDLNRFEIEFKRMRELNAFGLVMLSDLMNGDVMEKVMDRVLEKFGTVEMSKKYNYSLLSSRERELLYAGKSPEFWALEKVESKNTYKKKRAKYRYCIKRLDSQLQDDPKQIMMQMLSDKAKFLLSH